MRLYPIAAALILSFPACAEWKVTENVNPEGPGKAIDVRGEDGRIIARFVYGEGQFKPYLHVFGETGGFLTNPGLDREGKPSGGYLIIVGFSLAGRSFPNSERMTSGT